MAKRSIPDEINQYRPGPCTEVKLISGHYYVYMYHSRQLSSGKWGKKTGKSIGKIIPGIGFVPNKNFHLYSGEESQDEITVLEYGQYALIKEMGKDILLDLEQCFPADRARTIFSYACLLYANGFVHLDQVESYFEQSWLSQEYKPFQLKMGKTALGTLLDDLGRRTTRVVKYQNMAIQNSSSAIAIDGHAIRCCSEENDLGEAGYKYNCLKEDQVNLLMGYDINNGSPLFARIYRGTCNDKATIEDISELLKFSEILFVVDRGFYSAKNIKILSSNNNTYIITVPSNTDIFRNAMKDIEYTKNFYYRYGKKHSRIEYMSRKLNESEYVYVFRDIDENEKCRYNYLHNIELGKAGYTQDKFEENKEFFGVYVMQSNSSMPANEVFNSYKKSWGIETFYQFLKNQADFNDLKIQDYYKEQGLSFIMLVTGQIHQKMLEAIRKLNNNTISVHDVLLMARCMKMELRGKNWNLKNTRKKDLLIMKQLGFEPRAVVADL
ncbi:MAG: transposase [Lachnospiraceae bacterium]|nr:transposase [Lachnospiraceae bacterium]